MRTLGVVLSLAASACGSVSEEEVPVDGPPMVDAPPDTPVPVHHRYVIDAYRIPSTNPEARTYGLDLNADGTVDNQIGQVLATFSSMGIDTKPATKQAVDRGTSIALVDYATVDLADATGAGVALFNGLSPMPAPCTNANDTTCRHHLDGTGMFEAATAPVNPPLEGDVVAGTFVGGPGQLAMEIIFPGGGLAKFALIGAKIQIKDATDAEATLIIAGAATKDEVESKIYPAIRLEATNAMTRDCTSTTPPNCGCVAGSTGANYRSLFDTSPNNCTISPEEISGNSLIVSLFTADVMVGNVTATSFGIGAHAVKAQFASP